MYKFLLAAALTASFAANATNTGSHHISGDMAPEARLAKLYDVKVHAVKNSEQPTCWISASRDGKIITTDQVQPSKSAYKRDLLKACVDRNQMFELIQQAK